MEEDRVVQNKAGNNVKTMMIASYREKYSPENQKTIRNIIQKEKPDKIIVLKIIKEEETHEVVDATVGIKEKSDFLESLREGKKMQAKEYASSILDITDTIDVPTEVHLRKGCKISEEIINEFENMSIDLVIIHGPEEGMLPHLLEEDISKNVIESLGAKKVIVLA
ncbi:MAG: hypothetical protein R6U61_02790 [Thermoplasmata archaeon]